MSERYFSRNTREIGLNRFQVFSDEAQGVWQLSNSLLLFLSRKNFNLLIL
jgi:hypothetical protein